MGFDSGRSERERSRRPNPGCDVSIWEEGIAYCLRLEGPLESWRMPSWDNRDGYYEDGTVLPVTDVPIYAPPQLGGINAAFIERGVRSLMSAAAEYYRLERVPIECLGPFQRDTPSDRAWIEKYVDLIRRGSEPPPIICDASRKIIFNGSVRTHALRVLERKTVHAWVGDLYYKPVRTRQDELKERAAQGDQYAIAYLKAAKVSRDG
jgi:hypothetical protein